MLQFHYCILQKIVLKTVYKGSKCDIQEFVNKFIQKIIIKWDQEITKFYIRTRLLLNINVRQFFNKMLIIFHWVLLSVKIIQIFFPINVLMEWQNSCSTAYVSYKLILMTRCRFGCTRHEVASCTRSYHIPSSVLNFQGHSQTRLKLVEA